jgi:hypothetical protein
VDSTRPVIFVCLTAAVAAILGFVKGRFALHTRYRVGERDPGIHAAVENRAAPFPGVLTGFMIVDGCGGVVVLGSDRSNTARSSNRSRGTCQPRLPYPSDVRRHVVLAGERARRQRQKQRPVADQTGCRSLNHKRRPKSIAGHITYARRVPQSTTHGGFKMPLRKVSLRNPAGSENPAVSPWLCQLI